METRYLDLLDDEIIEFINQTEVFYPPDAANASVDQQRSYYNALCQSFAGSWPAGVTKVDRWLTSREESVLVRDYSMERKPANAHILYFHGGGFVVGSLESHDSICAELCARTGMPLTAVDYRLCPEFIHPAAFEDCLNVFRRLVTETDLPIILVGDSAGGTLAAAVAQRTRSDAPSLIGQLLIYPALGGDKSSQSYIEHKNAPMLSVADIEYYEKLRAGDRDLSFDVTATPLADENFNGLPPTVIVTAECDPLADDGTLYMQAVSEAGGKVACIKEAGLVHGFLRARSISSRASRSFASIVEALQMLEDKRWSF